MPQERDLLICDEADAAIYDPVVDFSQLTVNARCICLSATIGRSGEDIAETRFLQALRFDIISQPGEENALDFDRSWPTR